MNEDEKTVGDALGAHEDKVTLLFRELLRRTRESIPHPATDNTYIPSRGRQRARDDQRNFAIAAATVELTKS